MYRSASLGLARPKVLYRERYQLSQHDSTNQNRAVQPRTMRFTLDLTTEAPYPLLQESALSLGIV